MASTWKHPTLGQFKADGRTFSTTINVPAFKAFSYDTGYSNARRSTGKCNLMFSPFLSNEDLPKPTPQMVAIAEKIVGDPKKLVTMVAAGLWEEFNGRGPTIGMWWHGDMEMVNRSFKAAKLAPPKGPDDILAALQLTDIAIFPHLFEYPRPVAVLNFHAAFEDEHGMCLTTDGNRILGTSYAGEPEVWEDQKPSS